MAGKTNRQNAYNPYDFFNRNNSRFQFDSSGNLGVNMGSNDEPRYQYISDKQAGAGTSEAPEALEGGMGGGIMSAGLALNAALPDFYQWDYDDVPRTTKEAITGGDSKADPIGRMVTTLTGSGTKNAIDEINANTIDYSDIQNNQNLLNSWNSNDLQSNVDYKFGWGNIADNINAAGIGASYGAAIGGPWGAAIGASIGGTANIITQLGGRKRADKINEAINEANRKQIASFYNTANINHENDKLNALRNYYAEGGALEGLNDVTKFNYKVGKEYNVDENTYNRLIKMGYKIQVL